MDAVSAEFFRDFNFENSSWKGLYYDPFHLYFILFRHGIVVAGVRYRTEKKACVLYGKKSIGQIFFSSRAKSPS